MLKKSIQTVFAILLLPLAFFLVQVGLPSCSSEAQSKKEIARQKENELHRQVLQMAAKHNADGQWTKVKSMWGSYTLQLQRALLEPEGRAHLLLARIDDVVKLKDQYFLTVESYDAYFQLRCTEKQAEYMLRKSTNRPSVLTFYERYAIVFQAKSVHKPVAQLAVQPDGIDSFIFHEAADIVVVKGLCLDLIYLEDTYLDTEDLLTSEVVAAP